MQETINYLRDNLELKVLTDEPMSNHSSFKSGGEAAAVVFPETVESLIEAVKFLKSNNIKTKIIGRGSNILFSDDRLEVVFIKISTVLDDIEFLEDGLVDVGAGYSLQKLAKVSSKMGLSGLEFAGGIPGTLGGAIFMNAGAHTKEMKDIVQEVTIIDEQGNVKTLTVDECMFTYRHSIFQEKDYIIVGAKIKMDVLDKAAVFKKMLGNLEYRKEMQPLDMPTFGSVFKNPPNLHSGKLIEELGFKGKKVGNATISTKHANFIENLGDAKTSDAITLIKNIQEEVKSKKGIDLIVEVEIFREE